MKRPKVMADVVPRDVIWDELQKGHPMLVSGPTLRVPVHLLVPSICLLGLTICSAGCAGRPQDEAVYAMRLTPRVTF
jgi:hypothetical protein